MSDSPLFHVSREQTYLASMPNLAFTGVSENWLLKECGHQHWLALANLHERPLPDFRDDSGRIAYAAFTAVRSWDMALEKITENRHFHIHTRLSRAGLARHFSEHQIMLGERIVGRLALISTFVSRHTPGDNRSVNKACLAGSNAKIAHPSALLEELHADNRRLRTGEWKIHYGIHQQECGPLSVFDFSPCPDVDFNGAGFLYFANFQAMVERAEWAVLGLRRPGHIRRRELHFHGNLNIGDSLQIKLHPSQPSNKNLHWCELYRRSDGYKLADIFTEKAYPSDCSRP
jgi:probable biosynthetic protein (TIGR04099 family)